MQLKGRVSFYLEINVDVNYKAREHLSPYYMGMLKMSHVVVSARVSLDVT